jgi:ceramide glucosyltransferase
VPLTYLLASLLLIACLYQIAVVILATDFARTLRQERKFPPARFSQIKPLHQVSQPTLAAVESFLAQDAPAHDVYLCSPQPPPSEWIASHPEVTWLRLQADQQQNGKAATLALGSRYWSGDIFVISDADMWAPRDYLLGVLSEFRDPRVGVVTSLYRSTPPRPGDWCHLFESLCILDFSASVLVARRTEGLSFAMGSTMAIRRETLEAIGGFEALVPYLADDYQLGHRASKAGWEVRLAPTILETDPPGGQLANALRHQYRWLVTSRASRPGGHLAFVVTQGLLWATLLLMINPSLGAVTLPAWFLLRLFCGLKTHRCLDGKPGGDWQMLFLPWKDALYLALWLASLRGNTVRWGDRDLTIDADGRILS